MAAIGHFEFRPVVRRLGPCKARSVKVIDAGVMAGDHHDGCLIDLMGAGLGCVLVGQKVGRPSCPLQKGAQFQHLGLSQMGGVRLQENQRVGADGDFEPVVRDLLHRSQMIKEFMGVLPGKVMADRIFKNEIETGPIRA